MCMWKDFIKIVVTHVDTRITSNIAIRAFRCGLEFIAAEQKLENVPNNLLSIQFLFDFE